MIYLVRPFLSLSIIYLCIYVSIHRSQIINMYESLLSVEIICCLILVRDNLFPYSLFHPCISIEWASMESSCTLTGSVPGFLQLRHRLPELSSWASCVSAKRKGPIQQTGRSFRRFTVLRIPAQQTKLWADIVTARLPPQESTKTGSHAGLPHAEENQIFFVLWKCQIFWNAWLNLSYCGDLYPFVHNATNPSEPPSCSKHPQYNHILPLLTQRSSDLKCWFASCWFAMSRLVSCSAFDKGCCGQVGGTFRTQCASAANYDTDVEPWVVVFIWPSSKACGLASVVSTGLLC